MGMDEGNNHILAILVRAELERANGDWRRSARRYEQSRATLATVRGYLDLAERGRMTESEAMALIRGLLHG